MALPAFGQPAASAPAVEGPTPTAVELPAWISWGNFQTGFGYRDNVLLSHADADPSSFVRAGMIARLIHPAQSGGRSDYWAALNASGTHYFSTKTVSGVAGASTVSGEKFNEESDATLLLLWNYKLHDTLKLTLLASGYALDQIYDSSASELPPQATAQKTSGASVGPTLRWDFTPSWWVSIGASGKRENSPDGYYNRTVREAEAKLGWKPFSRLEVIATGRDRRSGYDVREQTKTGGSPLPGTILGTTDREGELRFDVSLDAAEHWTFSTRLITRRFTDNGRGFFNFRSRRVSPEIAWADGKWRVELEGMARRLDYDTQLVAKAGVGTPRVRDDYSAHLHVERELTPRWTVYADYTWERNRSNDIYTSYSLNEGLLGIRWNWDK